MNPCFDDVKVQFLTDCTITRMVPCSKGCCHDEKDFEFKKDDILECERYELDAYIQDKHYVMLSLLPSE